MSPKFQCPCSFETNSRTSFLEHRLSHCPDRRRPTMRPAPPPAEEDGDDESQSTFGRGVLATVGLILVLFVFGGIYRGRR